jgi:hypothetical protein
MLAMMAAVSISIPPPETLATEPPGADAYRCAPWTQAQGVDPVGSALTCDRLILVETPPPWPADVSEIPVFAEIGRLAGLSRTRLLAVRSVDDEPDDPAGAADTAAGPDGVPVTIWLRTPGGDFAGADYLLRADRLAAQIADLLAAPDGSGTPAPPELLLCGHGARDRCCGRFGTRLALDAAVAWPDLRVRRCSHTGGHRYAPTGFTLPDGLAWGFLTMDVVDRVIRHEGEPPLAGHYRGTTQLDMWGQVAERELFARFGWSWRANRLTSWGTTVAADGRSAAVQLAWAGPNGVGSATAAVEVSRDVPVLVCGEPPEKAKKTSPELALRSISVNIS